MLKGIPIPCRIAVSDPPGSGTTTLCRWLSELYGFRYNYAGDKFREIAASRKMPIEEFFAELAKDPELEKSIDRAEEEVMREEIYIIAEGRMAPFLAPELKKIKILLLVGHRVGVLRQMQRKENKGLTFEEVLKRSEKRLQDEKERYRNLYGIADHFDPAHFDIVIDTTNLTIEEVRTLALRLISRHVQKHALEL